MGLSAGASDRRESWPRAAGRTSPRAPRGAPGRPSARLSGRPSARLRSRLSARRCGGRSARCSGAPSVRCSRRPSGRSGAVGGPAGRGPVLESGRARADAFPSRGPLRSAPPARSPSRADRVSGGRDDGEPPRCPEPLPARPSGVHRAPRSERPAIRASYGTRSPRLLSSTARTGRGRAAVSLAEPAARPLACSPPCGRLRTVDSAARSSFVPGPVAEKRWGHGWLDRAAEVRVVSTRTRVDGLSDAVGAVGRRTSDRGRNVDPDSVAHRLPGEERSGRGRGDSRRLGREAEPGPRAGARRSSAARTVRAPSPRSRRVGEGESRCAGRAPRKLSPAAAGGGVLADGRPTWDARTRGAAVPPSRSARTLSRGGFTDDLSGPREAEPGRWEEGRPVQAPFPRTGSRPDGADPVLLTPGPLGRSRPPERSCEDSAGARRADDVPRPSPVRAPSRSRARGRRSRPPPLSVHWRGPDRSGRSRPARSSRSRPAGTTARAPAPAVRGRLSSVLMSRPPPPSKSCHHSTTDNAQKAAHP